MQLRQARPQKSVKSPATQEMEDITTAKELQMFRNQSDSRSLTGQPITPRCAASRTFVYLRYSGPGVLLLCLVF